MSSVPVPPISSVRVTFPVPASRVTVVVAPSPSVPKILGAIEIFPIPTSPSPALVSIVRSEAPVRTILLVAPSANVMFKLSVIKFGSVPERVKASPV